MITVLTTPALMLLCVFSEKVIFVWSGDPSLVDNTAPILSVFVIGVFLNCLMYMPAQLQLASGWVSLSIKTNLFAVVVLIPAIFWVVPHYGVIGAAWIWVILNAGYVLVAIQLMHRRLISNEKWKWYFADVLIPAIGVAGIMVFAVQFQPENNQDRWNDLVFLLIVGALSLLVATLLADQIRTRLWAVFKNKAAEA